MLMIMMCDGRNDGNIGVYDDDDNINVVDDDDDGNKLKLPW